MSVFYSNICGIRSSTNSNFRVSTVPSNTIFLIDVVHCTTAIGLIRILFGAFIIAGSLSIRGITRMLSNILAKPLPITIKIMIIITASLWRQALHQFALDKRRAHGWIIIIRTTHEILCILPCYWWVRSKSYKTKFLTLLCCCGRLIAFVLLANICYHWFHRCCMCLCDAISFQPILLVALLARLHQCMGIRFVYQCIHIQLPPYFAS